MNGSEPLFGTEKVQFQQGGNFETDLNFKKATLPIGSIILKHVLYQNPEIWGKYGICS